MFQNVDHLFLTGRLTDEWTMDELTSRVGPIDRSTALKALVTWMNLGVLKEDKENTFTLLEVAEETASDDAEHSSRIGNFLDLTLVNDN